ncbi:MAG TPA: inositol monophosphatase family protein [Tenuifilaceae bacterium]|nr:inositol monophosphatase family protein [Tenuifilaceae bacterium]
MNLTDICNQVIDIARSAGKFALNERKVFSFDKVKVKSENNFVSYVDTTCERMIVDKLSQILPKAGFIAEEGTGTPSSDGLNWVVDPLDGTTNFIHGLSPFAVSIALMEKSETLLGVVYEPNLDECFWATADDAAFLNGSKITVSGIGKVSDSLVATGFPYYDYSRIKPFFGTMEHFMRHSHGLRRLGSAATDLVYVACGRFEAFYEYGLSPWDVAAGAFIVRQAGGTVSDYSGGDNYVFGKEIIASNKKVYSEFFDVINSFMINLKADR